MVLRNCHALCHVIMKLWEHIGLDRVRYRLHVSLIHDSIFHKGGRV